ncbi:MAG: DUF3108 domain-containing protein [Candidatus Omnitrophota bacterium]
MKDLYKKLFYIFFGLLICAFPAMARPAFQPGEAVQYQIKKWALKVGTSELIYHGTVDTDKGRRVKIVFTADGFNFYDQETIYADPDTLLPLRVERDLDIFGNKENIVETYDPENGKVTVVKYNDGEETDRQIFEQEKPIDNLYCFLYRYRRDGEFEPGREIAMNLPTQTVKLEIIRDEKMAIAGKERSVYYMESRPSKYRVWFSADEEHVPLRIDGAVGLAKTAMIFTSCEQCGLTESQH